MRLPRVRRSYADLILALVSLVWGVMFVAAKEALEDISPVLYLTLRFLLASAALGYLFRRDLRAGIGTAEIRRGLLWGLF